MWGPPCELVTLKILLLRLSLQQFTFHPEPPAILQLELRFSYPHTIFHGGFRSWFSILVSCDFLFFFLKV